MNEQINSPMLAYQARSNLEANFIAGQLRELGIKAHVIEDNSLGGMDSQRWSSDYIKPKVFVERENLKEALGAIALMLKSQTEEHGQAICYHCGELLTSELAQVGRCPKCLKDLDVSADLPSDDSNAPVNWNLVFAISMCLMMLICAISLLQSFWK